MKTIEFKPLTDTDGSVVGYLHSPITEMEVHREKFPSVVICPGGAYAMVSQRESDPVAFEYLSAGYNVFILTYSVMDKAKDFVPLKELSQTLITIREHADEWHCDADKIAVCGFSAGGHLAASLATMWDNEEFKKHFDTKNGLNKPNGAILGYPVISSGSFAHVESIENVSGGKQGSNIYNFFSLENHVDEKTCPTFIWHTADDNCVPVENSLLFMTALQKEHIPFECHIFPAGPHGSSVCSEECYSPSDHNRQWVQLSKNWMNRLFDFKL